MKGTGFRLLSALIFLMVSAFFFINGFNSAGDEAEFSIFFGAVMVLIAILVLIVPGILDTLYPIETGTWEDDDDDE